VAAASIAESAASAAIVTLGFTVGTWALDFVAAGRGGLLQQIAIYTPTAALRSFEHGLLRLNIMAVILTVTLAGFVMAAIWLHPGRTNRERTVWTALLVIVLVGLSIGASRLRASWDKSENHRNSFSSVDEQLLKTIKSPLRITVYLSPEDPRLTDYEQNVLRKLRRVLPDLQVEYAAGTQTGLFENSGDHYGEIWYEMNGLKSMERSTIEEVVLDQIYSLANVSSPQRKGESDFPGYPLNAEPRHSALLFYLVWPVLVVLFWWIFRH
jgi:ABC-2 type transport system permease protein